jgi:sugar lactone lactonase YvrE
MRSPKIKNVTPLASLEGGRLVIEGTGFDPEEIGALKIAFNGLEARPIFVSKTRIVTIVPEQAYRGPLTVTIHKKTSNSFPIQLGTKIAENMNPVDNPLFDPAGNLYVAFSGKRGEMVPVSVFKIDPDRNVTPFLSNIPNATSLAMDPERNLYISSRFEGIVYRATPKADVTVFAKDLGVPTGLAFDLEGNLYAGDRNGRILKINQNGDVTTFAELPESMVAFHLAFDPEGNLLVTNPSMSSHNSVHMVDRYGKVIPLYGGFGRPQGLTVDPDGNIYICEAKAGESGVYKITPQGEKTLFLSGPVMVGIAFDRDRNLAVTTPDSVYLVPRVD